MPSPQAKSYASLTGKPIQGGRDHWPNALLDLIALAPARSWVQANTNFYSNCWAPAGLRTASSPANMARAWSSFAWDRTRHGFWFWGGGHANYSGNEVYFWSAVTRQWSLAFHTARVKTYTSGVNIGKAYESLDGPASPLSSHTYDNNIYLPILGRFLTFGGAGQGLGRPFSIFEGEARLRYVGCYTLQPGLAGQGFLGGLAGVNYQGSGYESVLLPEALAWEPRDWLLDNASFISLNVANNDHVNCGTCYAARNGHDAVFFMLRQVTSRRLMHVEFVDRDYRNDVVTRVSNASSDVGGGQGTIALDATQPVTLTVG